MNDRKLQDVILECYYDFSIKIAENFAFDKFVADYIKTNYKDFPYSDDAATKLIREGAVKYVDDRRFQQETKDLINE